MAEELANQEGKIEFTRAGEVPGQISPSQSGMMALRTARAAPGRRRWILRRKMVFDVLNDFEDESTYTVVLSFRPEGEFDGTPGQEQFKFSKTGRFEGRDVLSHPKSFRRFSIKRKTAAIGGFAVCALIGATVLVLAFIRNDPPCISSYCDQGSSISHTDSVTVRNFNTNSGIDNEPNSYASSAHAVSKAVPTDHGHQGTRFQRWRS